jgi:hypothetical protein
MFRVPPAAVIEVNMENSSVSMTEANIFKRPEGISNHVDHKVEFRK